LPSSKFSRLTLALDAEHPNDGPEHINLGVEYAVKEMVYFRAGYRYNYDQEMFTMGTGIRLDFWERSGWTMQSSPWRSLATPPSSQ